MNARRFRPWLPVVALAIAVVVLVAWHHFRPAAPPAPVLMSPPPYDNAALLREQLHSLHIEASVVPVPGRVDAFYVVAPGADVSAVRGPLDAADFPGCWEGVLLAETRGRADDGPNEVQAGQFHFFGDAAMVGRIRKAMGHPAGP